MASKAYDRAMKRLQGPTEAELAALIMQDVSQLSENAQGESGSRPARRQKPIALVLLTLHVQSDKMTLICGSLRVLRIERSCHSHDSVILSTAQGVTAYLHKPVHRERPNERFLQGTLRSVAFGELPTSPQDSPVNRTGHAPWQLLGLCQRRTLTL